MATATASPAARRRLRSRTSWPTADGPTPRPSGVEDGPMAEILLGFRDFGCEAIDERGACGHPRAAARQRVRDLVGLEQQILAIFRRGPVQRGPEVPLGADAIAGREARHRKPARLPRTRLRIPAKPFLVCHD